MHYTDQLNRNVIIKKDVRNIISVVPSQTELLYDLGLDEEVIGITKFCIHPKEWFRTKQRVGGTKNLNLEIIRQIEPDLILANKEENDFNQIAELMSEFPVWISDIKNLDDALRMIGSVSEITGKSDKGKIISEEISREFANLKFKNEKILHAIYIMWRNPFMAAGCDTFISDMLARAGFHNMVEANRYPEITVNEIKNLKPDVVLLSSEPYPFSEKHKIELKNELPGVHVQLVDGEMFSWYGSRLSKACGYFNLLHQQLRIAQYD